MSESEQVRKYSYLVVERKETAGIVAVDRPDKMNAVTPKVMSEMWKALAEFEQDNSISAVIITGSGEKAFIAGAEINQIADQDALSAAKGARQGQALANRIASCTKPVIAAVNGFALGGGLEICLACDIAVSVDDARFGFPEVRLGIIPGWGGTQRLSRLVGVRIAKEMIMTGELIDAKRAAEIGLVNRIVSRNELMSAVFKIVSQIQKNGKFAVKQAKRAVDRGIEMSLNSALEYEVECLASCFCTDEPKQGVDAFRKRKDQDE